MLILQLFGNSGFAVAIFLVAMVIAITVHEFAHAWTAYKLGDDTPHLMGRVNLNPLSHLDPLGSVLFLLTGFGWGKPVLYNPMRLGRKSDELLVALAGPASNVLLAILFNVLALVIPQLSSGFEPEAFQIAALVNVYLAAFNMIPIPPLDGSSIVAYFYPDYRSIAGGQIGMVILLALIFLPVGGGNLLGAIMDPLVHVFASASTLFGLLGNLASSF